MTPAVSGSRITFGLYEIDLQSGELWKAGFRVKLQSQPFKVLVALLERPGEVVSREELQRRVWGPDTNVDFDHSIGTAINKIREALGDSADNPRFIETLARRGYRFIAPVQRHEAASVAAAGVGPAVVPSDGPGVGSGVVPASAGDEPGLVVVSSAAAPVRSVEPGSAAKFVPGSRVEEASARVETAGRPVVRATLPAADQRLWFVVACGAVLLGLTGWGAYRLGSANARVTPEHITQVTHNGHFASSVITMENLASAATDGVHLFATVFDNGRAELAAIALPQGDTTVLDVPDEVASPAVGDISPDGSRLLLRDHLSPESEQPLWVVPTLGGSALRVGNTVAHDATWMPDGKGILYANGSRLLLTGVNGGAPEVYANLPGRALWLRWSPDGKLLRFTVADPLAHTLSLWQLPADDRKPQRILNGFHEPASECCGVWTSDGRWFVFQSSRGGNTDLWRLAGKEAEKAERVTDGPLQFQAPVAAKEGERVYFVGADARSELDHLAEGGELAPERGFLAAAMRVDYTRNGRWVAWTDTVGRLWCARSGGGEKLQLTPDELDVFMGRWSPDGTHLALMAREPGKAWSLYTIAADGSDLRQLRNDPHNAADPSWSPDGTTLVFGRTNDRMGQEQARSLEFLDLGSGAVRDLPGSEGLFSPRWSPDGRYIAALSLDQRKVKLFDMTTQQWSTLAVPSGADPVWSPDSRSLYLHASLSPGQPIERVSLPDAHVTEVAQLGRSAEANAVDYVLSGLGVDGRPLIRRRMYTGDLYSVDLGR